jgi:nucleotide-binding universal stress UspA family protein
MIHIVHVDHEGKMDGHSVQRLESGIRESGIYPSVKVNVFRDMEISDALERYIDDINADMLAMFTHKTTFFENLFGRSITREMAFQSHIPLLAIKK